MRTKYASALIAAMLLAGCGGTGGAGLPIASPGGVLSQSKSTTQAEAQSAMDPVQEDSLSASLFDGTAGATLDIAKRSSEMSLSGCTNRIERTVTHVSATETIYETKYFYDRACTQLAKDVVADVVQPSQSSETISRTSTWYNHSALQLGQRKSNFAVTGSPGNFSAVVTSDFFVGTSTSPESQRGRQLTVSPQSQTVFNVAGNGGWVDNDGVPSINQSVGGQGQTQNVTATVDGSGNVTFAGSHVETISKGALGSISLSSSPPFTITGGTVLGNRTATGSIEFDNQGNLVALNVNVVLINGGSAVLTSSGSPPSVSINGTIMDAGGKVLATFSVDQFGDGTITYADGQQGIIIDWHVVS
ncbi:MAG TPA: hypothetical protein VJN22_02190 [Candidatus Eremiobacteraceae bacterium]|nr:hypothetical protein [Candidatus Eremiobacteraceae bacterium]